ncbi:MAG: Hsp20/alpha crystallin family protein [Bacteroidetes bacterium]|nr:Hsp20/alpha crystallin family protein [Bacteroidota bacterium]
MALIKFNNRDLFPTFDNVWDDFFSNDFFNKGVKLGTTIPAVNVKETDREYKLDVAIPGLKKDDFKVHVENGILTISSENKQEKEEKNGEEVTRREFSYSSFSRSFSLPENADENNVNASYEDGILKIDVLKKVPAPVHGKRTIEIK